MSPAELRATPHDSRVCCQGAGSSGPGGAANRLPAGVVNCPVEALILRIKAPPPAQAGATVSRYRLPFQKADVQLVPREIRRAGPGPPTPPAMLTTRPAGDPPPAAPAAAARTTGAPWATSISVLASAATARPARYPSRCAGMATPSVG